jgi:hypothetical protein
MKVHKCAQCGIEFEGRANQLYCSQNCKAERNNRKARQQNSLVKGINDKLKKNHRILSELFDESSENILPKNILIHMGYQLQYMTHLVKDDKGRSGRSVYEFVLIENGDEIIIIRN